MPSSKEPPHPLHPPLPQPLAELSVEAIQAEQLRDGAAVHDFLMPPSDDLLRSAEQAGAGLSPAQLACKFLCFANPCAAFDPLRKSFLLQVCPNRELGQLRCSVLEGGAISEWSPMLDASEQEQLLRLVTEQADAYDSCAVSTGPLPGFDDHAWPCLAQDC